MYNKPKTEQIFAKMSEAMVAWWPHVVPDIVVNIIWGTDLEPHRCQTNTSSNDDL